MYVWVRIVGFVVVTYTNVHVHVHVVVVCCQSSFLVRHKLMLSEYNVPRLYIAHGPIWVCREHKMLTVSTKDILNPN